MTTNPKRPRRIKVEHSSGNIFADLGRPNPEELLAKAMLAIEIQDIVRESGWSQRVVATKLGVAPPDVSDLMRGRFSRFSQERLVRFLNKLDFEVRIQLAPRKKGARRAGVTVERVAAF